MIFKFSNIDRLSICTGSGDQSLILLSRRTLLSDRTRGPGLPFLKFLKIHIQFTQDQRTRIVIFKFSNLDRHSFCTGPGDQALILLSKRTLLSDRTRGPELQF